MTDLRTELTQHLSPLWRLLPNQETPELAIWIESDCHAPFVPNVVHRRDGINEAETAVEDFTPTYRIASGSRGSVSWTVGLSGMGRTEVMSLEFSCQTGDESESMIFAAEPADFVRHASLVSRLSALWGFEPMTSVPPVITRPEVVDGETQPRTFSMRSSDIWSDEGAIHQQLSDGAAAVAEAVAVTNAELRLLSAKSGFGRKSVLFVGPNGVVARNAGDIPSQGTTVWIEPCGAMRMVSQLLAPVAVTESAEPGSRVDADTTQGESMEPRSDQTLPEYLQELIAGESSTQIGLVTSPEGGVVGWQHDSVETRFFVPSLDEPVSLASLAPGDHAMQFLRIFEPMNAVQSQSNGPSTSSS